MCNHHEAENVEPVEFETPNFQENIKQGDYVLVDVKGGVRSATHFMYVCSVMSVDDDDREVQGLQKSNLSSTEFVEKADDIFHISIHEIIAVLPTPETWYTNRMITYKFPG